jgi:hypothetical protein
LTHEERLDAINAGLEAIHNGWPFFMSVLNERIEDHTRSLVQQNNDETRGRIKALQELLELPESLTQERDSISAALSDQDAAN